MKTFATRSAALGAAGLFALATGATAQAASSPHDKLAVWVGHWKMHIETKETQFGHAKTEDYDGKCSFLPHGTFMACEFLSLRPEPASGRIINDVSLFYYSDVDKTFKYTNVGPEGGPHENVLLVDGNVWTKPFEIAGQSGAVINARQVWTFVSPDKRLARLEVSIDKGAHWTVVNESVGTKGS
jgi:hypothetical protein